MKQIGFVFFCMWTFQYVSSFSSTVKNIDAKTSVDYYYQVDCLTIFEKSQCHTDQCGRKVVDGIFSTKDIEQLHRIVEKGMSHRDSLGGPTILDINTGYIRDSAGLENLFSRSQAVFSDNDFGHYGRIISKLKQAVMQTFELEKLYFTAPTFITRLDGTNNWEPQQIHDEYWHPHADHNNTPHYHYSGLLYMSTHNEHFTGGKFHFIDNKFSLFGDGSNVDLKSQQQDSSSSLATPTEKDIELTVEPRAGRVVMFTAGHENTHYVERVLSGQRFVLSFWFTCDPRREFEIFLDGKAHTTFSHKVRESTRRRRTEQQSTKARKSEL